MGVAAQAREGSAEAVEVELQEREALTAAEVAVAPAKVVKVVVRRSRLQRARRANGKTFHQQVGILVRLVSVVSSVIP